MRLFTIHQARELLPQLQVELSALRELHEKIQKEWGRIADLAGLEMSDPIITEHLVPNSAEIQLLAESARKIVEKLNETGVQIKSVEHGLVDFPCLLEDRVVFLCWRAGEEDVLYWHELDAGYSGRKLLMDASRAGRPGQLVN
jgi:hypothetical protein